MAQKPIGIMSRATGMPARCPMRPTTGRNRAAAATFCTKNETKAVDAHTSTSTRASEPPPWSRIQPATRCMTPVRSSPAPMIITAMMAITALEPKPENRAPSGSSGPTPGVRSAKPSRMSTLSAATSLRTTSNANSTTVRTSNASTTAIGASSVTGGMRRPGADGRRVAGECRV